MKIMSKHAVLLMALAASTVNAADLDDVLASSEKKVKASKASQVKIDSMAEKTQDIVSEYRQTSKLVDDLKVYNRKLEIQIENQNKRLQQIETSIADVQVIQRQITPLIERMIDSLEEFIALDMPFHMEDRKNSIVMLRNNLDRPDLSTAEKFRQVLEVYKIENEYGRKVDSYKDKIDIDGVEREVSMLRIGRIALLYQTSDLEKVGMWDQASRSWVALNPSDYRNAIRKGIRIATNKATTDILELPIAVTESN